MAVVIDPYLLAMPQTPGLGAEQVLDYALRLTAWEKEAGVKGHQFAMSSAAYLVMLEEDQLPTRENLQRLFAQHDITYVSARDVGVDCTGFLTNCSLLEDQAGVHDILDEIEYVAGSDSVIPVEMRERLTPRIADAFVKSLLYATCALQDKPQRHAWSIATAPLKQDHDRATLHVAGTMRRLSEDGSQIRNLALAEDWPLLVEPDYLYAAYSCAEHLEEPMLVTRIAWCKCKAKDTRTPAIQHKSYSFGEHFVDSLQDARMQRRPSHTHDVESVFMTVVAVLQGLAFGSDKHHALRKPLWSHTAEVQRRERMTETGSRVYDLAARVEVLGGPQPLRLHYWRCYDGAYEFSNVTTDHDDPTIYA
jgi:hypothetical protein